MRLYYTAKGASEPFARLGFGDPAKPRNNVDLAFLTPDGKSIDVRTLKPASGPCWVRDVVATEKNQAGDGKEIVEKTIELMEAVSKLYPARRAEPAVPWQVSLSHAVFVSAWDTKNARRRGGMDSRRIVLVPAPVDPALGKALGNAEVLRNFEPQHVFVRLDPKEAPPELADAFRRAGPAGIVLLDAAQTVEGFGRDQERMARTYPPVIEAKPGPHTKASVAALLGKASGR